MSGVLLRNKEEAHLPCAEDSWLRKGMKAGGGHGWGRCSKTEIITRLRGAGLDIPAAQVAGSAGGGRFTAQIKGLGSKGHQSASHGARWEVPWALAF